ncbi:hypothetical protein VPHD508_0101 [Vibrio phage D508]
MRELQIMEYLLSKEEVAALNEASIAEHKKITDTAEELKAIADSNNITIDVPTAANYSGLIYRPHKFIENRMIVSSELYSKIKGQPQKLRKDASDGINKACTQIATTLPIKFWGNEEPRIWGCPHATCPDCGSEGGWFNDTDCDCENMEYNECCDECPVQKYCTQSKEWSK